MARDNQGCLFDEFKDHVWEDEWIGMPEFIQEDLEPKFQIIVSFESEEDMEEFSKLVSQTITPNTRSIWYPEAEIGRISNKRYVDES